MKRQLLNPALPLGLTIIGAGAYFAGAGNLTPPIGTVSGTMKPLSDIEPRIAINTINTPGDADSLFKITQPGSYYLTGNITGVSGKHGIEIVTSGVALDLNGFDLLGVGGSLDGVRVTPTNQKNIAVIHGSVRNWGDSGVDLAFGLATGCRVDGVVASGNGGVAGINISRAGTISNCTASDNLENGIVADSGCTITNCAVYRNLSHGIYNNDDGTTISNCSAFDNGDNGIVTARCCTVSQCSVYSNAFTGITTSVGSTIISCSSVENGSGIYCDSASTVADCTVQSNTGDGIVCTSNCVIRGNTCTSNGFASGDGAGIHATGSDNRIEGNNCTGADRGIDVDFTGNIIIRNTCSGNTINWEIAASNAVAPIVQATTNGAPISGNTYAGSLGSTDPNANFTY